MSLSLNRPRFNLSHMAHKISGFLLKVIIHRPYWVLLGILGLSIFSLSLIINLQTYQPKLELDPSIDSLLPEHNADRDFFEQMKTIFDGGETILIALKAPPNESIFTQHNLQQIKTISEKLEQLAHVHRVASLSTVLNIRSENNQLLVDPFYDIPPSTQHGLQQLKQRALSDPIYKENLISLDGRISVIMVHLLDKSEKELLASQVDTKIYRIAQQYWTQADGAPGIIWHSGGAHIKAEISASMLQDVKTIIPLAMLVMAIIAGISFRTLRGILLPVLTIGISVLVTLAFIAWRYGTLNQVTITVPSLIVVIGFAYAVHVLSNYYDVLRLQASQKQTITKPTATVLLNITAPVIYTGITTSAGFFALATSPLSAIKQFGLSAGFGVLVTMVISLSFIPALLQVLPLPKQLVHQQQSTWLDNLLEKLALFDARNSKKILFIGALVGAISLAAIPHIKIGTDLISNFKIDSPVRRDFQSINQHLQGANSFEIVLETQVSEGFLEPPYLKTIEDLQNWLHQQQQIGGSTSITDYIKVLNKGFHGNENFNIPATKGLVDELLLLGSNDELDDFIDFNFQTARIIIRTSAMDSSDIMALSEKINTYLKEHIPPELDAQLTGNTYLIAKTMDDIAIGQALSIATAFIIIYLILVILFTSFKAGLIALIPNVIPVLLYFGILGWTGIQLNVTTGLVACIVLGIAVDDTIHLMAHFNRSAKQNADETAGIRSALKTVGRPVTYTTAALCLGFLCLLMSEMRSQIEFGLLAAVTLLAAWVVDITFTPAIASRMKVVSLWEVLSLNLGHSPHKSIPLFNGLSATQARIAALMADIVEYPQGKKIFHIGDTGNFMYVIIDGSISVTLNNSDGTIFIQTMKRGHILGEVALYHNKRTANAYVNSDVRLLRITKQDLENIQKRHPKIAAQLYANLNEVFAGRVADLTGRINA